MKPLIPAIQLIVFSALSVLLHLFSTAILGISMYVSSFVLGILLVGYFVVTGIHQYIISTHD